MEVFFINEEPITLTQLLKAMDYISSGGAAAFFLHENEVLLNGVRETAKRKKVFHNDIITINNTKIKVILHA